METAEGQGEWGHSIRISLTNSGNEVSIGQLRILFATLYPANLHRDIGGGATLEKVVMGGISRVGGGALRVQTAEQEQLSSWWLRKAWFPSWYHGKESLRDGWGVEGVAGRMG